MNAFTETLLARELLAESQLALLQHRSRLMGGSVDQHALEMGLLGLEDVLESYGASIGLPAASPLDLDRLSLERSAQFPARLAARYRLIPVDQRGLVLYALSDRKPSERQGEELAQLLGVELRARAIPPFLYRVLTRWLEQSPVDDDLALLTARLYPRFFIAPAPNEPTEQRTEEPLSAEPEHLAHRLGRCDNGAAQLDLVCDHLQGFAPLAGAWRIHGRVLKTTTQALTLDHLSPAIEALEPERVTYLAEPGAHWGTLCGHQAPLHSAAVRPIALRQRVVALLIIGSPFGGLDPRVCAQLEETAVLLSGSLEAQLG